MKKNIKSLLIIGLCALLAGCGSASNGFDYDYKYESAATDAYYSDGFYEESWDESESSSSSMDVSMDKPEVSDNRKLIKNYSLTVETENFDSLLPAIEARVAELDGYIESLNTYFGEMYSYRENRNSELTIRIPKQRADEFINFIGNSANITRQSLDVSDVTLTYVDMASRRDSYIVERDRLLTLLEQAENLEDILTIEARLSEVRYSLESMESQLRTMDNRVDYSTIRMSVREVKKYTEPEPETYGERLVSSFTDGISDFVEWLADGSIWFVGALPFLLLFAVLMVLIVFILKKFDAKSKAKWEKEKAKFANIGLNKETENKQEEKEEDKDAE